MRNQLTSSQRARLAAIERALATCPDWQRDYWRRMRETFIRQIGAAR